MINQIIIALLGLFVGLYSTTVGGVAASAIMMYVLLHYKIIAPYDKLVGTLLFISAFPISLTALYEYYKRKRIDYYSSFILVITISVGMCIGTKYNFIIEDQNGAGLITKYKNLFNSLCFGLLSILFLFET
jgi:uncharacterized membrane protein YfcA